MKQKTIIKAERGTLLVTLMENENGEDELCKEPVIAWCITIHEKEDFIDVEPLTTNGNADNDTMWAIQYPPSKEHSFKYDIPFVASFENDSRLLAEFKEEKEMRKKWKARRSNPKS